MSKIKAGEMLQIKRQKW